LLYPEHRTIGSRGYFAKRGSRSCIPQRTNTEPRADVMRLACWQSLHNPASTLVIEGAC
jgi:hypothetical protein